MPASNDQPPIVVVMLTPQERRVLGLLADGRSSKEVAKALLISPSTVQNYIAQIRIKTRTRNTSHMVAYAIRSGLLPAV